MMIACCAPRYGELRILVPAMRTAVTRRQNSGSSSAYSGLPSPAVEMSVKSGLTSTSEICKWMEWHCLQQTFSQFHIMLLTNSPFSSVRLVTPCLKCYSKTNKTHEDSEVSCCTHMLEVTMSLLHQLHLSITCLQPELHHDKFYIKAM